MKFDNRFRKRQSEPGTLMLAVENRVDAVERLQHQRDILGTHAYSIISDADAQPGRVDLA